MFAGLSYLFTEKDLRLFLRGRTIKQVVPIREDSEPIIIKFTDKYQIKITHKPRSLEKGRYAPYFDVEVLDPDHRVVLQKQLHDLNVSDGKYKTPLKPDKTKKRKRKRGDA